MRLNVKECHLFMLAVVTPVKSMKKVGEKIAFVFQVRDNCQGLE